MNAVLLSLKQAMRLLLCACGPQSDSEGGSDSDTETRRPRRVKGFTPDDHWVHRHKLWFRWWTGAGPAAELAYPKSLYTSGVRRVRKPTWTPGASRRVPSYDTLSRRAASRRCMAALADALITQPMVDAFLALSTVANKPYPQLFKDLVRQITEEESGGSALSPRAKLREAKKIDDEIRRLPVFGPSTCVCESV